MHQLIQLLHVEVLAASVLDLLDLLLEQVEATSLLPNDVLLQVVQTLAGLGLNGREVLGLQLNGQQVFQLREAAKGQF